MAPDPSLTAEHCQSYVRPRSLREAMSALAVPGSIVLAGGTDIYPAHVGRRLPARLVDVSAVAEMRGIAPQGDAVRFGGATTWTEVANAALPRAFSTLQDAARQIGSLQVQNRATIAGNLCNASPAADGIPPLLALDAVVELASLAGVRRVPLADFIVGYRKTALRGGDILTAVFVPMPAPEARSAFVKLGARKYLVISIVMAAALVCRNASGAIVGCRVAVGSASEKAQRLRLLEHDLQGFPRGRAPSSGLRFDHFATLKPIDDARATARYRSDVVWHLVGTAIDRAAES